METREKISEIMKKIANAHSILAEANRELAGITELESFTRPKVQRLTADEIHAMTEEIIELRRQRPEKVSEQTFQFIYGIQSYLQRRGVLTERQTQSLIRTHETLFLSEES